ncbi:hypothetical protein, partial [Chromobacterium amazonense]|uniref:hypothetical protein n=1 Tax=Chromobacterium amazonense TaxID=1382803 RepID=UPI0031F6BF50
DGFVVHRAVVRLSSKTSAYFFGRGGLYAGLGERARLNVQDGTVVMYCSLLLTLLPPEPRGLVSV